MLFLFPRRKLNKLSRDKRTHRPFPDYFAKLTCTYSSKLIMQSRATSNASSSTIKSFFSCRTSGNQKKKQNYVKTSLAKREGSVDCCQQGSLPIAFVFRIAPIKADPFAVRMGCFTRATVSSIDKPASEVSESVLPTNYFCKIGNTAKRLRVIN